MKSIRTLLPAILFALTGSLQAQKLPTIGMTPAEFNKIVPDILPSEFIYNRNLYLNEKLQSIDGRWSFGFYNNSLNSASFSNEVRLNSEAEFTTWVNSAELIIADYTKTYGEPTSYQQGTNKWVDRNTVEYENKIGKREVFEEAVWQTKTMKIKLICDFRSNYYEEFQEGLPNGPNEWYSYCFIIKYSYLYENKLPAEAVGRFYLGENVDDFAKAFPSLFPNGVGLTGQWGRKEKIYGLDGGWAYNFDSGKLEWMLYDNYIHEINGKNFDKCLSATKNLIEDYTKLFGKPDTTMIGDTTFKDPALKRHWGYDVMEVRWKDYKGEKLKVEFTFMGGKGEYAFLVKIAFFEKNYPYYD